MLNYKKPALWIVAAALVLCAAAAVYFLTNPKTSREFPMEGINVSDLDPQRTVGSIAKIVGLDYSSQLSVNPLNSMSLRLTSDFDWADAGAIPFFYTKDGQTLNAQLRLFSDDNRFFVTKSEKWPEQDRIFSLQNYLEAFKYLPQEQLSQLSPDADMYLAVFRDGGAPGDYESVVTYTSNGEGAIDGWLIHLELQPFREDGDAYKGTGDGAIHLFYGVAD